MFVLTYWTLVYRRPNGRPVNIPMLFVAIIMFVLATMVGGNLYESIVNLGHWNSLLRSLIQQLAVNFTRIIRGFIINEGQTGDYYNKLAEFTQIFGSALYIVQTFVGDAVAVRIFLFIADKISNGGTLDISMLHRMEPQAGIYRIPVHDIPWQSR